MKGFRFYADLPGTLGYNDKPLLPLRTTIRKLKEHADAGGHLNCIALFLGNEHACPDGTQEALSSTFWNADSDVSSGAVCREVLGKCRHISEALARKLHPRLFERLDHA